jgi:DNA-binding PadR family transcriptional regulator
MVKKNEPFCPPDLLRGNTDILLLSMIDELGASYGYQLIKHIENRSNGFFRFREGTIYPALRKLENEGFTIGEWQTLPNGLRRRYYHLTEKGVKLLRAKKSTWRDFTAAVDLVLKPG